MSEETVEKKPKKRWVAWTVAGVVALLVGAAGVTIAQDAFKDEDTADKDVAPAATTEATPESEAPAETTTPTPTVTPTPTATVTPTPAPTVNPNPPAGGPGGISSGL